MAGALVLIELAARASGSLAYRAGVVVAVGASVMLLWVNGAVGFLGDEDNPANLIFGAVLLTVAIGAFVARFRAAGMARAMFAAAGVQLLIGVIALAAGLGSQGYAGLYEVVMGTTLSWPSGFCRAGCSSRQHASSAPPLSPLPQSAHAALRASACATFATSSSSPAPEFRPSPE
jgi:hypothetical protein